MPALFRPAFLTVLLLSACPGEELPLCVEVDTNCAPLYAPTYDNVFTQTLNPTCAQPGTACHATAGAKGGLVFDDANDAYDLLLGNTDGRTRIVPGDAACSPMAVRIQETRGAFRMPPGDSLSPAEQCAIIQWIDQGANR